MKTLFIETIKKLELNEEKFNELEKLLPNTVYIAYSIQYKKLAEQSKEKLKKTFKILGFSQILGCSELKTSAKAILLLGEARFHALNLALSSGKEVYIFDNHSISKITLEEIEKLRKQEKGKYLKYLTSSKIGILVSFKSGQENLELALKLKKEIETKGKTPYFFLADNINAPELENFPIELWINTACSGISSDSGRILNYKQITNK